MATETDILTKAVDKGCGVMEKVSHRLWDREDLVQAESAGRFRNEDSLDAPSGQIEINSCILVAFNSARPPKGQTIVLSPKRDTSSFSHHRQSTCFHEPLARFLGGPSHLKPLTSDQSPSHNDDKT